MLSNITIGLPSGKKSQKFDQHLTATKMQLLLQIKSSTNHFERPKERA
jgi:hypothetical protein